MLLDDQEKTVSLYVDNLIWGNVKLIVTKQTKWQFSEGELPQLQQDMHTWLSLRKTNKKSDDYLTLTDKLYKNFIEYRVVGLMEGHIRDRDEEAEISKLKSDNRDLVEMIATQKKQLDQLYLESPDKKNIRGIT